MLRVAGCAGSMTPMNTDRPDLLALRHAAGLTDRTAAAALIGVNQSTLWRWETGKAWPSKHVLAAVLDMYETARVAYVAAGGGAE